jgi:hypothetical protein
VRFADRRSRRRAGGTNGGFRDACFFRSRGKEDEGTADARRSHRQDGTSGGHGWTRIGLASKGGLGIFGRSQSARLGCSRGRGARRHGRLFGVACFLNIAILDEQSQSAVFGRQGPGACHQVRPIWLRSFKIDMSLLSSIQLACGRPSVVCTTSMSER